MTNLFTKVTIVLFFFTTISYSQIDSLIVNSRDINDILRELFRKTDTTDLNNKKVAFSLLPIPVDATANTGLVVSFLSTFYLGKDHETTKMSQVTFAPSFSFNGQYVFPIQSYIYTNENKYNFTGDYRYFIYPQKTYGLGNHTTDKEMSVLDYQQWRFYQFVTRKIKGNFRLGAGVLLDNYQNISEESQIAEPTDYYRYMNGDYSDVSSFGIALQALYDSRINTINPEQGYFLEIDYRMNTNGGIENQSWQSLYIDARKYQSLSTTRHKVMAYRAFWWSTFRGDPNYLDLPSIGWDRQGKTGRGFTRNRFRSNALIYFEGEYRTDITRNGFLGAVFFANIASVSKLDTYVFSKWHPAVGSGLRIKWNKKNNTNVAIDLGISQHDWSLRLGLVENF